MAATDGHLRASDAERDRVIEDLHRHAADGRLTMDEFEQRVGEALVATTRDELEPVLRDLPPVHAARPVDTSRRPHRAWWPSVADGRLVVAAVATIVVVTLIASGAWWMWWIVFPLTGALSRRRGGWCSNHREDDHADRAGSDRDPVDRHREAVTV